MGESIILLCRTRGQSWDYSFVSPQPNTMAFKKFTNWYGLHCSLAYGDFNEIEAISIDGQNLYCRSYEVESLSKDPQGRCIMIYYALISSNEDMLNRSDEWLSKIQRKIIAAQAKINSKEYGDAARFEFMSELNGFGLSERKSKHGFLGAVFAVLAIPLSFLARCSS